MRIALPLKLMASYLLVAGLIVLPCLWSLRHEPSSHALLVLRLSAGAGISAAIVLSLVAAIYLSYPLRRLRDATRAFAQAKFVKVEGIGMGDELEDLAGALDDLGHRLRQQLVELGAQETLLTQAVQSFSVPAVLWHNDLQPMLVNGAFRRFAEITPVNEGQRLAELTRAGSFIAARKEAERTGLPIDLTLPPLPGATSAAVAGTLVPLCRPHSPPLWLLVIDIKGPESEARGPEAVQLHLRSAEVILERLWDEQPPLRAALAQLRRKLDEAAFAAGRPEAVGVEPVEAADLLQRCVEEVRALHPEALERLRLDVKASCKIAESAGLSARAVRLFISGALRALPKERTLEVSLSIEPQVVKLHLAGAVPGDLGAVSELARALGTDVGRVKHREREAAWLSLPRA